MFKIFEMEELKPMNTLMSSFIKLDENNEDTFIDVTKYQGMVRSLLYLIASRSDIMFSVCLCMRFQSNPKESHISALK